MYWININDKLPVFGRPVLVKNIDGIIQNVLYYREKTDKGFLWKTAIDVMGDDFAFMDNFPFWLETIYKNYYCNNCPKEVNCSGCPRFSKHCKKCTNGG